jgi:DNA phosphorothioation-dependent restriction protein DptG
MALMWLEEGLCQFIDSEVYPPLQQQRAERIAGITEWYDWEDLWNDLSSCEDANKAYLQAYKKTRTLVERGGKPEIIKLLYLNRTQQVDWKELSGD